MGKFWNYLLIGNEGEVAWFFPLLRGDLRGVLRGEARVGLRCSRYSLEKHVAAIERGRAFVKI